MLIFEHKGWGTIGLLALVFIYGLVLPIRNDDAYITARFARNLAAGAGFVYNPGERVLGTTTPLFTLELAGPMAVIPATWALQLVAALTLTLASAAFIVFGQRLGQPRAGLVAALFFPVMGPQACYYGNEIPLCIALFLLCAGWIQTGRARRAGVAAGLLGLARGEGLLYGGLLGLWLLRRAGWRRALIFGAFAAAILAPWFLFSRGYFGAWLPHTLAIKRLQGQLAPGRGAVPWMPYLHGTWTFLRWSWLWPGSIFGVAAWLGLPRLLRRGGAVLALWAAAHTALYALLRVPDYPWYHYPLFALTAWSAGCGMEWIMERCARFASNGRGIGSPRIVAAAGLLLTLLVVAGSAWQGLRLDSPAVPNRWMMNRCQAYRQLGDYLAGHATPDEAVMLDEIGIAGFYGWPARVLDSNSLIHRDLPPSLIGDPNALALARRPAWIKTYHAQGPYYAACGGGRTLVYRQVGEFRAGSLNPALYRLLPAPPPDYDQGFYAAENWGGSPVQWSRRVAEIPFTACARSLRLKYFVGHPALTEANPLTLTLTVSGGRRLEFIHTAKGYYDRALDLGGLPPTTQTLRLEVSRTWTSPEGRQLGIAVYPLGFK